MSSINIKNRIWLFGGLICFIMIFGVVQLNRIFKISQSNKYKYQIIQNSNKTTAKSPTFETPKINILIGMAISCDMDITEITNSLKYNKNKLQIYWIFNVYDYHISPTNCNVKLTENEWNNIDNNITHSTNIHVVYHSITKLEFWLLCFNPNKFNIFKNNINIKNNGIDSFDIIGFMDNDLYLNWFNFNTFIDLMIKLDTSIIQPCILGICKQCRSSDFKDITTNHKYNRNIIAKEVDIIEIMTPFFKLNAWKIIYKMINEVKQKNNIIRFGSNWGPDVYWCNAVKNLLNNSNSCIVSFLTPLIHINTKTIDKSNIEQFEEIGKKQFEIFGKHFSQFEAKSYRNYNYKHKGQEFYANDLVE